MTSNFQQNTWVPRERDRNGIFSLQICQSDAAEIKWKDGAGWVEEGAPCRSWSRYSQRWSVVLLFCAMGFKCSAGLERKSERERECGSVHMSVCISVCCVCVCMCSRVYVCLCVFVCKWIHVNVCMLVRVCVCMHKCVYHVRVCALTCI